MTKASCSETSNQVHCLNITLPSGTWCSLPNSVLILLNEACLCTDNILFDKSRDRLVFCDFGDSQQMAVNQVDLACWSTCWTNCGYGSSR